MMKRQQKFKVTGLNEIGQFPNRPYWKRHREIWTSPT